MTRSQSLGKEEAGVLGLREEEGPRRKDEEAEQSRQDVRWDLLVQVGRFLA